MNITIEDIFLILFVWIDDWYQEHYSSRRKARRPVAMSDSEILMLMIGINFVEFESERHYIAFLHAHYKDLFPMLLDHSQYNRRERALGGKLELVRQALGMELNLGKEKYHMIDTNPVIAVGYRRNKSHSDFFGSAGFGYCAARKMHYFGYKLVLSCTLDGISGQAELLPANVDERFAADEILDRLPLGTITIGDKGFIGREWQNEWAALGIKLVTPARENQYEQPNKVTTEFISALRERIGGVYKVLKEGGRSVEYTLAHTVEGLCVRVLSKITSLTARIFLRRNWGVDVLTFTQQNKI